MNLSEFVKKKVKPMEGKMILVGGRPAMGKTTFIVNVVKSAADSGQKFLYFDLEGGGKELIEQKSINNVTVIETDGNGFDMTFIKKTCSEFENISEYIVVIDYLQLIAGNDDGFTGIQNALSELVSELGITLIVTSQLSREIEDRSDKRPRPDDFSLDNVNEKLFSEIWLLYRAAYYDDEADATSIEVITRDETYEFCWNGKTRTVE